MDVRSSVASPGTNANTCCRSSKSTSPRRAGDSSSCPKNGRCFDYRLTRSGRADPLSCERPPQPLLRTEPRLGDPRSIGVGIVSRRVEQLDCLIDHRRPKIGVASKDVVGVHPLRHSLDHPDGGCALIDLRRCCPSEARGIGGWYECRCQPYCNGAKVMTARWSDPHRLPDSLPGTSAPSPRKGPSRRCRPLPVTTTFTACMAN